MSVTADRDTSGSRALTSSYRMLVGVEPGVPVIEGVIDQFGAWLRNKKQWDPPLRDNGFVSQPGRDLVTLRRDSSDGTDLRLRLTEDSDNGVWRTQLTVHTDPSGSAWLALLVTNSKGRWVAVPGIAGNLLDALPVIDGSTRLSPGARVVTPAGVDDFLDEICDPGRQGLLFVAGSAHATIDFDAFKERFERWAYRVRGLAQFVLLTPQATHEVRDALGADHQVHPGTIRTFYPGVDPAVASDGLRHRFLTRQRLEKESQEAIARLLERIARRHAASRSLPENYLRVDRALRRIEDRMLIEGLAAHLEPLEVEDVVGDEHATFVSPAPTSPEVEMVRDASEQLVAETESYLALIEMVKRTLGIEELTEAALKELAQQAKNAHVVADSIARVSRELDDKQSQVQQLEDELRTLQNDLEDTQLEERIAAEQASRLADENRWLKQRLAEMKDPEAYAPIPDEARTRYPNDFAELYARRGEIERLGVVLTADAEEMLALDEHDTLGKVVATAWDCLLTLGDYIRARKEGLCDANVKSYLQSVPQGYRGVPPKKFGEGETAVTMDAWGSERVFPVPKSIALEGKATMEAHFKLGKIGMISPRMYYLDCYSRSGKIYVGYIGAHLRNTQT